MIIVGLMSGTSADGTDAVCVRIEGSPPSLSWELLSHISHPYTPELRKAIFDAFLPQTATVDMLCQLNFTLAETFAQAALEAITAAKLKPRQVSAIGSHGQTVWHIPPGSMGVPSTLQLGNPSVIAQRTGVTVVSDFRARDMAAGGQGAPLVPYVDSLLLSHPTLSRAVQNIGGIGNVSYLPAHSQGRDVIAFDTGPGNMLIDYAAGRSTGGKLTFDRDGELASRGRVNQALVDQWMTHPYFAQKPPKSTGRETFGVQMGEKLYDEALAKGLTAEDIVATFTAFTAQSIAQSYKDYLPTIPDQTLICGGGTKNPVLMAEVARRLPGTKVFTCDQMGLPSQAKEAVSFAILAYETLNRRPGNLPSATGATSPVVLGSITYR
jgi:anhydro-N-acetylmuramic acid kinase